MSELGSLASFFVDSIETAQKKNRLEISEKSRAVPRKGPSVKTKRKLSIYSQFDQSTDGYIYTSVHQDKESLLRLGSAAPTNRSVRIKGNTQFIQKRKLRTRILSRKEDFERPAVPTSVKMQEKIRNELLMKNSHFIMRSMRKNLREDEKKNNDSICESNNLFHRLVKKVLDSTKDHQQIRFKKNNEAEKVVQKSSEAVEKSVKASSSAWMKKRGGQDEREDSNIAKVIFMMLDPENKREISESVLVKFLLEIGLCLHPARIREVLRIVLKKESVSFKLRIEDISYLCKGDHRCNLIIKFLNDEVREERFNKTDGFKSDSSLFSIKEQLNILNIWWNLIDRNMVSQVSVSLVAEFLAAKSIVGDSHEGRKLIKEIVNDSQVIDKEDFFAVFARSMIKWLLINVPKRFTKEEWKNTAYSPAFKITCLNRNLIMAGLKCNKSGFSQEEGNMVISAIEKYKKFSGETLPVSDLNLDSSWAEMVTSHPNKGVKGRLKISSVQKILDEDRPQTVPTNRLESENTFYSEFQKFVSS